MEVLFGHKFFGYDVLPQKPRSWQLESCLPPKKTVPSLLQMWPQTPLYVLEEEAMWKIGVLVEV